MRSRRCLRRAEREVLPLLQPVVVLAPHVFVQLRHLGHVVRAVGVVEKRADDDDAAAGVQHVHDRLRVLWRDLDGGVHAGGGGAADEQRDGEAAALHLLGHVHHLVQRRRDQTAQTDHDSLLLDWLPPVCAQCSAHYSQVDNAVVVAAEHDADDVLADVVHVSLHCGDDDDARVAAAFLQLRRPRRPQRWRPGAPPPSPPP